MKCPMLMYNYLPNESPTEGKRIDCIGEECAWWEKVHGGCGVLALYRELRLLVGACGVVADKMPTKFTNLGSKR